MAGLVQSLGRGRGGSVGTGVERRGGGMGGGERESFGGNATGTVTATAASDRLSVD